jgi:hypothetical protein
MTRDFWANGIISAKNIDSKSKNGRVSAKINLS